MAVRYQKPSRKPLDMPLQPAPESPTTMVD
jgi:hypothetical protein